MNYEKNIWLLIKFFVIILITCLVSIIGIFIFAPIVNFLLRNEPSSLPAVAGFAVAFISIFMSFGFFYCLSVSIFAKKTKYLFLMIVLILDLLPIFIMNWGSSNVYIKANVEIIIILIPTMIAGWLIGEGILRLYKKIKK